jgi:hypothetical protein
MTKQYQFRVHRHPTINDAATHTTRINNYLTDVGSNNAKTQREINHPLHFCLTLMTFGLWGVIWWRLILTARGEAGFISALDDDYWSYLIEREQPPAALYQVHIGQKSTETVFEA